jgi:hypothetical protein
LEVILGNNLLLKPFQFRAQEFDRPVTLGTDNVVMVGVLVKVLKACPAVSQICLSGQSTISQGFECPEDGCVTKLRVSLPHIVIELIGAEMALTS